MADTAGTDGAKTAADGESLLESGAAASYGAAEVAAPGTKPKGPPSYAPLAAEFLGTLVLVFTVGCAVASPAPGAWAATSIASVLMVMIYATGPISGGNLNPAVSFALALMGKLDWTKMLQYWLVQFLGGALGAGLYRAVCWPHVVKVAPVKPFTAGYSVSAEIIYTAMLCFVVLNCAASRRNNPPSDPNQFFGLAIGFVIVAGGYAVGGVSGAAFNPAVALGLGLTSGKTVQWAFLWSVAELIGAMIGAGLFRVLRKEEFQQPQLSDENLAKFAPALPIRCLAEMVGTFMLVLTVGLNIVTGSPSTAFSAAAALMCMIYSLGNISGAHLNPAVTMAVLLSRRGKCSPIDAACYMGSQLLAGILAAAVYAAFQEGSRNANKSIKLAPGKNYGLPQAALAELLATMVLAYVVLSVATVRVPPAWKTKQNAVFGLAIGACVTAGGFADGSVSGGELNPAVSLGLATANQMNPGRSGVAPFTYCLVFMLCEIVGGVLAACAFRVTHPAEYNELPRAAESVPDTEAPDSGS